MRISISNIAWSCEDDQYMYTKLQEMGIQGLEIAPTRLFDEKPYEKIDDAKKYVENLYNVFGLSISSMQSIWYGRNEKIWGSIEERQCLIDYTKAAIDFAAAIKCPNLVFGCPKNRVIPENGDKNVAIEFFREIGEYASNRGTCIGMEANPPIYNTNFINTTHEALELIREVDSDGFKLNLDLGTMICNSENFEVLKGSSQLINHIHISEPGLNAIEKRDTHFELREFIEKNCYSGYVSIEMKNLNNIKHVIGTIEYINSVFDKGEKK